MFQFRTGNRKWDCKPIAAINPPGAAFVARTCPSQLNFPALIKHPVWPSGSAGSSGYRSKIIQDDPP
jgi:hypothetical protein